MLQDERAWGLWPLGWVSVRMELVDFLSDTLAKIFRGGHISSP